MYEIQEFLHHGNYIHRGGAKGKTIKQALLAALEASPYNANLAADPTDERIGAMVLRLIVNGTASFGWANYTLVRPS